MRGITTASIVLLVALAGCTTTTVNDSQVTTPALLTVPPPPVAHKSVMAKAKFSALSAAAPVVVPDVLKSNSLGIVSRGTNVVLYWPTNMNEYAILSSTNATTPVNMWQFIRKDNALLNDDRYELTMHKDSETAVFTMVRAESNSVILFWEYDFTANPGVKGFVLYSGASSRLYTNRIDVGMCLWHTASVFVGTNYFAATAYDLVGLESDYSAEAVYVETNP